MKKETEQLIEKYKEQINEALEDLKTPGRRHKQIPNILTTARLLSPLFIIPSALTGNVLLTASMAAGFGLTDLVDGFIARNWKLTSPLGADLDAVTDKVYIGTLLIASSIFNPVLLVNLGLEGLIAGINTTQKLSGKKAASTFMGKVKTGAIFALGGLSLIAPSLALHPAILPAASLGTAIMQGMTIASYLKKYNSEDTPIQPAHEDYASTEAQIEPIQDDIPEKENVKVYESEVRPNTITAKPDNILEQLREESAFLHQEQVRIHGQTPNESEVSQERSSVHGNKVYEKTNSN